MFVAYCLKMSDIMNTKTHYCGSAPRMLPAKRNEGTKVQVYDVCIVSKYCDMPQGTFQLQAVAILKNKIINP